MTIARVNSYPNHGIAPFPKLQPERVALGLIEGVDPDIQKFLDRWGVLPDNPLDLGAWQAEPLRVLCRMMPLVVAKRAGGYQVVGSGRMLRFAQKTMSAHEEIDVLVIPSGRIRHEVKLQFLAIELLGFSAIFRTRRNMPEHLFQLSRMLSAEGVQLFADGSKKAFRQATGFSKATIADSADPASPP